MDERALKLFFSVGEPSGDLHAANLLRSLRHLEPRIAGRGFGGVRFQEAGGQLDFALTDLAVVGFVEVVPKLREFFRVADVASSIFDRERPDAVVLVDFPGFNWHIAKRAKSQGIPVFYYLPPQLWAWGSWRVRKMKRYVDHVLCNLPFEQAWYLKRGVHSDYVGHPFFDEVRDRELDRRVMSDGCQTNGCKVAVLPGSRSREVRHIWPMQLEIIRELSARYPGTRFMVACLKDSHCLWCRSQLTNSDSSLDLQFFVDKTSELIELADCALMKSGSVSLEMMARGTPSVVIYHVGRMLYAIGKTLSQVEHLSLPNLIADRTIMPEFLAVGRCKAPTIERTVAALDRLIGDPEERARQREELAALANRFAQPGASRRAAEFIVQRLRAGSAEILPAMPREAA